MKNTFKFLIHKPIYLVFVFILIFYFPHAISAAPEGVDRQHASTFGLDISTDGIEVSMLSFVSEQSETFARKYLLVSAQAENISKALDKIANISGRKVALTHVSVIVLSAELAESGAEKYLDFFYRNANLSNDTYIICTKGKAKDLLQFERQRVNSTGLGLDDMTFYNSKNWYFLDTNIESFYKGYFSPTSCSVIGIVELEDNQDGEQLGSSAGSSSSSSSSGGAMAGGSGGSSSSSHTQQKVKSMGKFGIFRNGKLIKILSEEETWATSIINPRTKDNYFYLSNYSDENLDDVTIVFTVEDNLVSRKTFFEGEKPVIEFNILVNLSIEEIITNKVEKLYFYNTTNFLTPTMKTKIESRGKQLFSNLLKTLIEEKADILSFYGTFYDQQQTKFVKWYENLSNPEDFLSLIEYRMTIHSALTK